MSIEAKCDFIDMQISRYDNSANLIFKLQEKNFKIVDKINEMQQKGKGLRLNISVYREKRSLDANAYFHLLVNKIARINGIGDDECKIKMNLEYGTPATKGDGEEIYINLPCDVDIKMFYDYAKFIKTINGKSYYLMYKRTSELNTKEMARLIDGTVETAKELGIETKTPEEIANMLSLMEKEWK